MYQRIKGGGESPLGWARGMALPFESPQGPMGPASAPTGDPGLEADALSKVREAVNILQMALPQLQIGSDPYKAVLDSIQKLAKTVPASEAVPGVQMTQLAGLQKQAQESAMLQSLAGAMGQGPAIPPVQPQ